MANRAELTEKAFYALKYVAFPAFVMLTLFSVTLALAN